MTVPYFAPPSRDCSLQFSCLSTSYQPLDNFVYLMVNVDIALRLMPASVPLNVSVHVPWVTFLLAIKVTVELTGTAPRLIEDGLIEQVVLAGFPEHPRATVPVKFALGVTAIVNCAWCPEGMVCVAGVTLTEKSPTV